MSKETELSFKRETGIDLQDFLENRQAETLQIETNSGDFITVYCFEMQQPAMVLPSGYAVCGGAARNTLLQELGEKVKPPRDIDIVGIEEWIPDRSLMNRLARIFMPDDLKHGHTVSMSSFKDYFLNRDFTVNEVLVTGKKIYVTEQGLLDLQDKIVRRGHDIQKLIVWHAATEADIDAYLRQTFGEQYLKAVSDREEMQMLS